MLGTLFFVHGTGVRQEGWVTTWGRVQDNAQIHGITGVNFVGCAWGPKLGVRLDLIPETLPAPVITRGSGAPTELEVGAAAWALLGEDPLFELRIAAEAAPAVDAGVVIGRLRADQGALEVLRDLASRASTLDLSATGLSSDEVRQAAGELAGTAELQGAARAAGSASDPDLIEAVARALVAGVLAHHRWDESGSAPVVAYDRARRDALVQQLREALVPATTRAAMTGWLKQKAAGFAARKATQLAARRRQELMDMSTPTVGDILFYQRRGGEILSFVARGLARATPPVVAVGHSLGGIILVDLLSREDAPRVDLLVTAGSQPAMLYAIDALDRLRPGQVAPVPFKPWLNIYNRQDALSFCAARVFPGFDGIQDEEVDPGVPFPESHGAYWTCGRVYDLIREHWPRSGIAPP
jgi:hypothetical protein